MNYLLLNKETRKVEDLTRPRPKRPGEFNIDEATCACVVMSLALSCFVQVPDAAMGACAHFTFATLVLTY